MGTLFAITVTVIIAGWLWFYIIRPILEDYGVIGVPKTVNNSEPVMSRPAPPAQVQTTDRQADRPSVSVDSLELPRLRLDRTKQAIIEVMVYNGWQVGEIRAVIKGDNGAIGAEIEAAKKKLGIETAENRTPIAGRPTDATFASDLK